MDRIKREAIKGLLKTRDIVTIKTKDGEIEQYKMNTSTNRINKLTKRVGTTIKKKVYKKK